VNNEDLFTAEEAAAEVGIDASTIYTWVRRGYLGYAGRRGRNKLVRLSDVFRAESDRKAKHRRKS